MSLINNMLKDLERRSQGNGKNSDLKLVTMKTATPRKIPRKTLLLWVSLIILFIFASLSFFVKKHTIAARPFNPYNNVTTKPETLSFATTSKQILLKGSTISDGKHFNSLSLSFNHLPQYTIDYDSLKNEYIVNLYNVQLSSQKPDILSHDIIRNVSFSKQDSGLKLVLDLSPNTELYEVSDIQNGSDIQLVFSFKRDELDVDNRSQTKIHSQSGNNHLQGKKESSLIKKPAIQSTLHEKYLSAIIDMEHERINSAEEKLKYVLNNDPEYHDARSTYVALLLKKKNNKEALIELNNGLKLNPDHIPYIELKARLLASENKYNSALVLLKTVNPSLRDNQDYYSLMALLYEKLDMNQLAAQTYKQLLSTNQHNGNWWIGLGLALEKLGQSNSAADAYRHALTEENLNSETLAYVQNQLNAIEGLQ